tara:strand:- start:177 stop:377 length:201 start_codon:yes stop_codon:yes gene_type:complete
MPYKVQKALRLSRTILDRADALIDELAGDERIAAMGSMSQTAVLRLAIIKGLKILEKELDDHDAKD